MASVSISATTASAAEGGLLAYTLTRTGDPSETLTVNLFPSGTGAAPATPGADFFAPLSVTFLPGQTAKTLRFPARVDAITEASETFSLSVASSPAYEIGTGTATFTIADVPPAVVSLTAATASAGEGFPLAYTVTREGGDLASGLVVNLSVAGSGPSPATPGSDVFVPLSVTFAPGEISRTVSFTPTVDTASEASETFTLTLQGGSNYQTSPIASTATFSIQDVAAPVVSVQATNPTVSEGYNGTTNAAFTISLDHAVGYGVSVTYQTQGGTATPGEDFSGQAGSVFIAAGQTSATVLVPVFGDAKAEANETFSLQLTGASGFGAQTPVLGTSTAGVTITNDDVTPVVSVRALDGHAYESNGGDQLIYLFERTGDLSQGLSVTYSLAPVGSGAVAGVDYAPPGGQSIFFAPGSASAFVFMLPINDALSEGTEQFTIAVNAGSGYAVSGSQGSAVGTIIDDETAGAASPSTLTLSGVTTSAAEGGFLSFKISRTGDLSTGVTGNVSLVSGSATAGTDVIIPLTPRMLAGESERVFTIAVRPDALAEGTETFVLKLLGSASYTADTAAGVNQATFTIADVPPAVVSLTAATASAGEGFPLAYTVTRDGDLSAGLVVNLSAAGSGANPATPGGDVFVPLSVTFAPGEASRTVSFTPTVDTTTESPETFTLTLQGGTNYQASPGASTATFSIQDVAAPVVSVQATTPTVSEGYNGQTNAAFTISLDHAVGYGVSVTYQTQAGTATAGEDFSGQSGSVFIAAGQTSATVLVPVFGDAKAEANEGFSLQLTGASGFGLQVPMLDTSAAGVTITNDDATPVVSIEGIDGIGREGASVSFLAVRTGDLSQALAVPFTLTAAASNGAVLGSDYSWTGPQTIFFAPGSATATVGFPVAADGVTEPAETFTLALSGGSGYALDPAKASAVGTLLDAPPTISIAATTAAAEEGGMLVATLTRTGDLSKSLAVQVVAAPTAVDGASPTGAVFGDYADFSFTSYAYFQAGKATATVNAYTLWDNRVEVTEHFTLGVVAPAGYSAGPAATFDILDKPFPTYSIASAVTSATEGGALSVTVTRSGYTAGESTVGFSFSSSDGAIRDRDVTVPTLTFAAGETTKTLVIGTFLDALAEGPEHFTLTLNGAYPAAVGANPSATFTITERDLAALPAPIVSVVATDGTSTGATDDGYTFTFTRTGDLSAPLAVSYVFDGVPNAWVLPAIGLIGADQIADHSLVFAAGSSTATLTLAPIDGASSQYYGDFAVALKPSASYVVGENSLAVGHFGQDLGFHGNAAALSVTLAATGVVEGGSLGFEVQRTGFNMGEAFTVTLRVEPLVTARAGIDEDFPNQYVTVTFDPYQTTATGSLQTLADTLAEGTEHFVLRVEDDPMQRYVGIGSGAVFAVREPAAPPTLTIAAATTSLTEGDNLYVTVTRTGDLSGVLVVDLVAAPTGNDGATAGDYSVQQQAYFSAGAATATVAIYVGRDTLVEATEHFTLAVTPPSGYTAGPALTFDILDRGFSTYAITAATTSAVEGQPLSLTIVRTGDVSEAGYVILDFASADSVLQGRDVAVPYSVDFAANETTKTLTLDTFLDKLPEGSEHFTVTLAATPASPPYAVGANASATFTIADRDLAANPAPTVTVVATDGYADGTVDDGYVFTFSRSGDLSAALEINYALVEVPGAGISLINAVGGYDGTSPFDRHLSFAAGEATATLTLSPPEGSVGVSGGGTFALVLKPGSSYVPGVADIAFGELATSSYGGPGYDSAPRVLVTPAATTVAEGGALAFTASWSSAYGYRDPSQPLTITVRAVSLTPNNEATDLGTATVTFEPWQMTATGSIQVVADAIREGSEHFVLVADGYDNATGSTIVARANANSAFTVVEEVVAKPAISIAATTAATSEGGTLLATLTRTGNLTEPLTVTLALTGAPAPGATPGGDFVAPGLTVTFAPDNATATVTVQTLLDVLAEPTEHLTLALQPASAYTIAAGAGAATFDILDKVPPTITVEATDATALEGAAGDGLAFTFTRTGDLSAPLTVAYTFGGTASPGQDHSGFSYDSVTFAAGSATSVRAVTVFDDVRVEGTETVTVALTQPTGPGAAYLIGAQGSASASIADDDPGSWPAVSIAAVRASASEGGQLSYVLTRVGGGGAQRRRPGRAPRRRIGREPG